MPRNRWVPKAGDDCLKGEHERGRVIERISPRTNRPYLTVQILTGPRRWQFEFADRGWRLDDGTEAGPDRQDDDDHEHHTPGGYAYLRQIAACGPGAVVSTPRELTPEELERWQQLKAQDEMDSPF